MSAEEFYKKGLDKYILKHDFKGTIADLNQALHLNPNLAKAYTLRGIAYLKLGDYQQTVADCTQALRLNPHDADAYYNRGVAYLQLRNYQAAVTDCTQAFRLNPDDARAYYNGGFAHLQLGNYKAAVADYTQTLQFNPNNAAAYNERGIAHYKLGDYQSAVADYTQAIQHNPDDVGAYYNRGDAHYGLGKYQQAIADYTEAIWLKPDYTLAYNNRGNAYLQLRKPQKALADYTYALQLNPNDEGAYYNRGIVYFQLKDYQQALADFTQASKLNPNYIEAYFYYGAGCIKIGDYQKAVANFTQVIQLNPDYADAYYNRGESHLQLEDYSEAVKDFQYAANLFQKQGNVDYYLQALRRIREITDESLDEADYQTADADYTQAIRLNADAANAYYKRGNAYLQQGNYRAAVADYTQAIRFAPDNIAIYQNRNIAYFKLKDYQAAFADCERMLYLAPHFAPAYVERGAASTKLGNRQAASADFSRAIQLDPSIAQAYFNRAITQFELENFEEAIADFQQAAKLYSEQGNFAAQQDALKGISIVKEQLCDRISEETETDDPQEIEFDANDAEVENSNSQSKNYQKVNEEDVRRHGEIDNSVTLQANAQKQYLTEADDIRTLISNLASAQVLWLDTETSNFNTSNPKISLIQVLVDPEDLTGDRVYLLDVLNKPDLVTHFVDQIMVNPKIEKVFHNASYDLKFLGREQAKNVTCTYKLAQQITKSVLQVTDLKLKTLAAQLCNFSDIDKQEQGSDWGRRPLTSKQIKYAKMDPVYLAQVHHHLLKVAKLTSCTKPNANGIRGSSCTKTKSQADLRQIKGIRTREGGFCLYRRDFNRQVQDMSKKNPTPVVPMSLSVTNVKVAFECPRLFYLGHHFGGKTMFLPGGNLSGIGTAFHDLSEQFVKLAKQDRRFQTLFEPAFEQLQVEVIAPQLQKLFYDLAFFPYLQSTIQNAPSKAAALHQLWQGLTGLIRRWTELLVGNRRYCSAREVIPKTFLAQELNVKHEFTLPDGTQQLVKGRFDSLVYDFEQQRLCVVEYKTYQSVDCSAQLAQVALYSYMLQEKIGVSINSAVYSVLPDLQELAFSWEQLENTIHQSIPQKLQQMQQWLSWEPLQTNPPAPTSQPYLCDICPQRQKCKSFFNQKITDTSTVDEPLVTDNGTGEKLVATLKSFGISVDYQGTVVGPAFIRVKLKPHAGVKVSSILRLSHDVQVQLGLAKPPLIAPQVGYISFDLPRTDRQIAGFEQYIQPQALSPQAAVKIAIGVNLEGQLIEADLSDPNTCHFLVGGTTGSGKSEFLRSLLLSLLIRYSPNKLKIALVDPKRVTFPELEQVSWLYSPVVKESDRAIELMEQLVEEMERRYQLFEAAGCADLSAYNQQVSQLMPRIVCLFDEYADFMVEKETRTALEQSIKRLGSMARAAGIHLIIATQRPEAKVVTPIIRSNLPGRVALRTASEADSALVLRGKQTAAAYLLGKGDLLYDDGAGLHRLQSLFVTDLQLP